jgi:hypothetical protein
MSLNLPELITSADPAVRNQALEALCRTASLEELLDQAEQLEDFRKSSDNLYHRVRALFFLCALHRFHLPGLIPPGSTGRIPFEGYEHLLKRRFEEAITGFRQTCAQSGPTDATSSALAEAYHGLAFQTLADQVRHSVRSVRGNQWMFRIGHPEDHPLRIRRELLVRSGETGLFPVLCEHTPVRMDLSHSAWSDIFFLGMDYPEAAQVLNVSIDLCVHGTGSAPRPPVEAYLRVIDEPVLRLTSVDLEATVDIEDLADVFDFAKDYLGLLKAAVIASGLVPPGIEGSGQDLAHLLARIVAPGHGLEIVSSVNHIPKGSRLAVSTNLLAALTAACMRATHQTRSLTGPLEEEERQTVAVRAILGEWLGGSGGGWQDSGGVWPGIKLIRGVAAGEGDPEHGISRGRLLPRHEILGTERIPAEARASLQNSLVLVHGGMAQNVGPILEMVTEKYLLRSGAEWEARHNATEILGEILDALQSNDIRRLGEATTRNFYGPLQTIIPWATNRYTESLVDAVRSEFGDRFWGFWMLGGMSGGGMGFIFAPECRPAAQIRLQELMLQNKRDLEHGLPFAMDPVVYDFSVNESGSSSRLLEGADALLPSGYYALQVPRTLRQDTRRLSPARRSEMDRFGSACRERPELDNMVQVLFDRLFPAEHDGAAARSDLTGQLAEHGFDATQHEEIRRDLRSGRIGLAQNRLPTRVEILDVQPGDILDARKPLPEKLRALGIDAIRNQCVAVISLAAGVGSRWTQGAGTVKALHPFCKFGARHRTFLEVHLAKSRQTNHLWNGTIPHVFSTSYMTHAPIQAALEREANYGYEGPLILSPGRAVGLRMIPMQRDLRFAWEERPQQLLDVQKQKVRESLQTALMNWAAQAGEASDYTDNQTLQCLHPVGHWYEIPNLLRNGVLARLLEQQPNLSHLLLHNIDTLGADIDPALLGAHIESGACLTYEVIARRIDDRGGGLARVDGRVRLVEGLAMPREEDEFNLSYYNSMTTWIDIDRLLEVFRLTRASLNDPESVIRAVRLMATRVPTYVTLKDVKKRWGNGQEDVFPVAQFEKLWGDMSALPEIDCRFAVVPRVRGQQLKDQAQLDGWVRDGSAAHVNSLCRWPSD